ncbi:chorismate-binding protein, partial [Anaerostipes hadrus]|uniref:chorismate-binding protein n=1 Tax=Anaerostipes hadrus TaxID=649756 RepID=UPI001D06B01C
RGFAGKVGKKTGRHILSTCLAGSIKRGRNEAEDLELGKALLSDQKNLSEHGFVVSMIRQVLEPFCNGLNVP